MPLSKNNQIFGNNQFQGLDVVIDHLVKKYSTITHTEKTIRPLVKSGFEQQLIKVVTGALSFKNRPD